jgi:hypothetical protein
LTASERAEIGARIPQLVDEVLRTGDESELAVMPAAVEGGVETRDALGERRALAVEVIEVLVDRGRDRAPHRGGAGVEIDQDRRREPRQCQGEIDRERRLADSTFAGRDGYDSLGHGG